MIERCRRGALSGLLAGAMAVVAVAQGADPFAGHWTLDKSQASESGMRPPVCGTACVISVDGSKLTVDVIGRGPDTYDLSGTPTVSTIRGGGFETRQEVTARRDGSAIVVTRTTTTGPNRLQSVARLTIESGRLIIEARQPSRSGDTRNVRYVLLRAS